MQCHQRVTLEEALCGEPVLIYSPTYSEYLFVSNDKMDGDNIVESHGVQNRGEARNLFVLQKRGDNDNCLLYNMSNARWLFVSNDKKGGDHVVEAHPDKKEERNMFHLQVVNRDRYRIYNPSYKEYLFVSNDTKDGDHIVESHPQVDEERNEFLLELAEPPQIERIEFLTYQLKVIEQKAPLVIGQMRYRNATNVLQSMNFNIAKTESYQSSYTYSHGFAVQVACKFSGGVPCLLGNEMTVTTSTSHTWDSTTTSTSTCTISGHVTANSAPQSDTEAKVMIEQQEVEVPYKMTLLTKNNSRFYSYGVYKGVALMKLCYETVQVQIE